MDSVVNRPHNVNQWTRLIPKSTLNGKRPSRTWTVTLVSRWCQPAETGPTWVTHTWTTGSHRPCDPCVVAVNWGQPETEQTTTAKEEVKTRRGSRRVWSCCCAELCSQVLSDPITENIFWMINPTHTESDAQVYDVILLRVDDTRQITGSHFEAGEPCSGTQWSTKTPKLSLLPKHYWNLD